MRRLSVLPGWLLAVVVGLVVATVVAVSGFVMLHAAVSSSAPALEQATRSGAEAIGRAVAGQFQRAIDLGIPIRELPGVESYLEGVAASSPQVEALALVDRSGAVIFGTSEHARGLRFPLRSPDMPVTLVLEQRSLLLDEAVLRLRLDIVLAAFLTALLAGLVVLLFDRLYIKPSRARLAGALERAAGGYFDIHQTIEGRGRVVEVFHALARCLDPVRNAASHLADGVATVRAIDFDGSLARRLEPITRSVEARYRLPPLGSDETQPLRPAQGSGLLLQLAVLAGLYAAPLPMVANFAVDRASDVVPEAWWPVVPLAAELAALLVAVVVSLALPTGLARFAGALGALLAASATAYVAWCYAYEDFVWLRLAAGLGIGLAAGSLRPERGAEARIGWSALFILAGLCIGPLLGGLLGDAVGRRMTFLILGLSLLPLAALMAARPRPPGPAAMRAAGDPFGAALIALAFAAVGMLTLIEIPVGPGYENYIFSGGALAVLGLAALLIPPLPPLAAALFVAAGIAPLLLIDGLELMLLLITCAAIGLGIGALVKCRRAAPATLLFAAAIGLFAGVMAAGLAAPIVVPPVALIGYVAVIVALAQAGRRPAAASVG